MEFNFTVNKEHVTNSLKDLFNITGSDVLIDMNININKTIEEEVDMSIFEPYGAVEVVVEPLNVKNLLKENCISQKDLCNRWELKTQQTVVLHIKKRDIRTDDGKVYLSEVDRHESLLKSGKYVGYNVFRDFITRNYHLSKSTVGRECVRSNMNKRWIAGDYYVLIDNARKVINKYNGIGGDTEEILKYMVSGK